MSNFTLQDIAGSALGVAVFALALYVPGYLLGHATDLFGFRRRGVRERICWAICYSFAVTPIAAYLVSKFAGLTVSCWILVGIAPLWALIAWRGRRDFTWSHRETVSACIAALWVSFVILSLVDIHLGHRLYFSVVEDDQSYRVAFTNAVLRTGVPPANPLYFAGHLQPMRYYYFWYVVVAMVSRIGHVTARQAFIASSVWAGFGLASICALYSRHFLPTREGTRSKSWIAIALLAVTGADLLPALGERVAKIPLHADMEWWSNDQITSWADSLLWVPHHVASLLCCLVAFLLLWICHTAIRQWNRVVVFLLVALSLASAFGLSIYVAFGFALLLVAWVVRLLAGRPRNSSLALLIVAAGTGGIVVLAPFLREMIGETSGSRNTASIGPLHVFAPGVRGMIDSSVLTGLPAFASWHAIHPILTEQLARLVLLPPGLALELGFYGAVLYLYIRHYRRYPADGPHRTALFLAVGGLILALFVRSAVIGSNDFGYRVALLPQFFLLLLGADLLASWRFGTGDPIIISTPTRQRLVYGLLALGLAGTAYQVALLRVYIPLETMRSGTMFPDLPALVFQGREAFAELDRVSAQSAVVEFNPVDPQPGGAGDVISPFTFYTRSLLMNANRQILNADPGCSTEFGGDPLSCDAIMKSTAQLYALPARSAHWAREYCARFGVEYLAVSRIDPAWSDASGWVAGLPVVASEPDFRIVRCAER
jgi:hypothetical protein